MEKIIRHSAETAARIDMSFITRNNARNSSYSNIKKFYNTLKSDVPPLESFGSKANGEKERLNENEKFSTEPGFTQEVEEQGKKEKCFT